MERDSILYKLRRKGQVLAGKLLPAEWMTKIYSRIVLKKKVDLQHPVTFNEKIQWCKLYYYPNEPLVVKCTDKYSVREYVRDKGLSQILVPLHGDWYDARDIQWEELPDRFVLKCNHGCAYNIVCTDKALLDRKAAEGQLNRWLKEDFGLFNIEPHYSRIIPHRIICEEFLGESLYDYKFFCFHGEPKFVYVSCDLIHDRQAQIGFFELDGRKLPLKRNDYADLESVKFPSFFDDMKQAAEILCADFPFVRVDFLLANDTFYFSELTFTPGGGMMLIQPTYDAEWGKLLDISLLFEDYEE